MNSDQALPHPWDDLTEEELKEIEKGYYMADDPYEPYPEWHDDN